VRLAHLLLLGACAHRVCTRQGLYSCETTPTAFVVWPLPCIGENEVCGGLAEKLDSEDIGERLKGPCLVLVIE